MNDLLEESLGSRVGTLTSRLEGNSFQINIVQ